MFSASALLFKRGKRGSRANMCRYCFSLLSQTRVDKRWNNSLMISVIRRLLSSTVREIRCDKKVWIADLCSTSVSPSVQVKFSLLHLGGGSQAVAWPYGTDSCLSLQLALQVLVGDTRRHAHPTAAGALGPVSGLDWTLLLRVVPLWVLDTWRVKGREKKESHTPQLGCWFPTLRFWTPSRGHKMNLRGLFVFLWWLQHGSTDGNITLLFGWSTTLVETEIS